MTTNLRCDASFVQDESWYAAARRYEDFLRRYKNGRILFLELGVGGNTPGIIKVPFLRMTAQNPRATYACINLGEAITMRGLEEQSILLAADIGAVLSDLRSPESIKHKNASPKSVMTHHWPCEGSIFLFHSSSNFAGQ